MAMFGASTFLVEASNNPNAHADHYSRAYFLVFKPCIWFVMSRMPAHSMWSDAVVMAVQAITFTIDVQHDRVMNTRWVCERMSFAALVMQFMGVHIAPCTGFIVASCFAHMCVDPNCWTVKFMAMIAATLLFVKFGVTVEFQIARLFLDQQEEHMLNEFLLDHTTDGFCRVECSSGIIRSASPQLENTLKCPTLSGMQLVDVINASDHDIIINLLQSALMGKDMEPSLVSCRRVSQEGVMTFDAKVIPCTVSGHMLKVCLQVQGELRMKPTASNERCTPAAGSGGHTGQKSEMGPKSCSFVGDTMLNDCASSASSDQSQDSFCYTVTGTEASRLSRHRSRIDLDALEVSEAAVQTAFVQMEDRTTQTGGVTTIVPASGKPPLPERPCRRGRSLPKNDTQGINLVSFTKAIGTEPAAIDPVGTSVQQRLPVDIPKDPAGTSTAQKQTVIDDKYPVLLPSLVESTIKTRARRRRLGHEMFKSN